MSDEFGKDKTDVEKLDQMDRLGWLIESYAQSRTLPLLIPLAMMTLNVVLLLAAGKVAELLIFHLQISEYWFEVIVVGAIAWVVLLCPWVTGKLMARYGDWPYRKEGIIKLKEEKVPIWAWAVFLITTIGPTVLSLFEIMPVRWALLMALVSFGACMLYMGMKQRAKALGLLWGGLCLIVAIATALGIPAPFASKIWPYSFFAALMIYIVGAGLITTVVVHIYNRRILRRIKQMEPFGEQGRSQSDS
jgi:hypothetical protein